MTTQPQWTTKYKQNWPEAYTRMMAWWAGDGLDRPLVFTPATRAGAPRFTPDHWPGPAESEMDEAFQLAGTRHRLENHCYLAETAPFVWTAYGSLLCMLAAMAEGPVYYDGTTGMPWMAWWTTCSPAPCRCLMPPARPMPSPFT